MMPLISDAIQLRKALVFTKNFLVAQNDTLKIDSSIDSNQTIRLKCEFQDYIAVCKEHRKRWKWQAENFKSRAFFESKISSGLNGAFRAVILAHGQLAWKGTNLTTIKFWTILKIKFANL